MNPFYYIDTLNTSDTKNLDELLKIKLEDQHYDESQRFSVHFSAKKSDSSKKIINMIAPFFEKAGLVINRDDGYIDYISHEFDSIKYTDSYFDIGCINDELDDVNVCYLVTRKDEHLKNGNMDVYKEYTILNSIGYKQAEKIEVPLNTSTIFITNGDTTHKIKGCLGNGNLNIIRIVFYKTNDSNK